MLGFLGIEQHKQLFDHLEDSCPQNMSPLPSLGAQVDGSEPARPVGGGAGDGRGAAGEVARSTIYSEDTCSSS